MDDQTGHSNGLNTLLNLNAAASRFGLSTGTLRRLLTRGLRCYRPSSTGKILLDPRDVLAFLSVQQKPQPDLDAMVTATLQELQREGLR